MLQQSGHFIRAALERCGPVQMDMPGLKLRIPSTSFLPVFFRPLPIFDICAHLDAQSPGLRLHTAWAAKIPDTHDFHYSFPFLHQRT